MQQTMRVFVFSLLLSLLIAACGDAPVVEDPALEGSGDVAGDAEQVPAPESPLAMDSPLAMPTGAPLPEEYARPDGPYLLFSSSTDGERGRYLLNLTTEEVTPAPLDHLDDYRIDSLSWVSDLSLFIAQLTDAQNESDLYLLDFEGQIVARLTYDPYEEGNADYSPVTGLFAYVCLQQDLDICITAPNDPELLNITAMNTREAGPKWSPDGETVLYVSNAAGIVNVWAVDPDGTNRRNLSEVGLGTTLREEGDASWSPDGELIVFRSHADGAPNIYVMDPDGTNRRNLTDSPNNDITPIWSPNGEYIAFRSQGDAGQDIHVIELATETIVNVTNSPDTRENNFVWSSDSERIYFDAQVDGVFDIYVVNRDGSERRNLTESDTDDLDPQWVE
jgi:Tol biopolymer transport system component